ncbi:MAG TPA: magnesium/cobalt transporter CorA [Gammaproteobacteria bacterium]|nr:magnesium/cobalt transporter CorA [Gammaproteobacteria bacterium]
MLINCAAYQEGKKLTEIRKDEIAEWLRKPGCFVWVALRDPDPAEMAEMKAQFGLHELAVEDALSGSQRPKVEEYGDSLFASVQTLEPAAAGELKVGELYIFVGPNYVLSCRRQTERSFAEVRNRAEREPHLLKHGSGYVLYALMDAAVDRYFPVLERLEDELEVLEERIFDRSSPRANIEALYQLKQKLGVLKHATGPAVEAVGKLFGGRVPMVCAHMGEYFRDIYDHLVRLNQEIDTARDTISTAISVNISMIALQENETTKKLASYAALIAIPTLIVGIYGMNFQDMPELHWRFGYPICLAVMTFIDVYLYSRFKQANWL